MATLTFNGESFAVDHAAKGADYIHGYDADGVLIVSFDGITDFSGFSYDGSYMNPSDCLTELCNGMVYCGGKVKTRGGADISPEAIGAAPASHATNKNNPHGVTAAQVGARPNTWLPSLSEIGAAPASHGNHLYFQDNTFTTNGADVTTITTPGKIVAVFINFKGQSSEWNHDLMYVPTSNRHAPFYCYDMINSAVEQWPMQLYWYADNSIGVGRYQGNSAQFTCYCRTLYVQN